MVIAIYIITLLISSSLLFLVQPMFAKMILPRLGGTPAVWNTCMLFFQAALLAGYLYADLSTRWLGPRKQAIVHIAALVAALAFLPLGIGDQWVPTADHNPIVWLLVLLGATIGVPFVVVSASAPLFQRWFSATGHPSAGDPYFLYSASNLGSMSALLAYPLLIEPSLTLSQQSTVWTAGFVALIVCASLCAVAVWRTRPKVVPAAMALDSQVESVPLTWRRRAWWIALAFVPSSLMLGATTYITTDLAVVPLLWVIPLGLYLLTFILVFARREKQPHTWMMRLLPPALLVLVLLLLVDVALPAHILIGGHLAAFFVIALVCHGEIADDRPAPKRLTEYYLLMSLGGVLGGLFNAVIAPVAFESIAEYPLVIIAGCFLWKSSRHRQKPLGSAWNSLLKSALPAIALGAVAAGLLLLAERLRLGHGALRQLLTVFVPVLLCLALLKTRWGFGIGVASVMAATTLIAGNDRQQLEAERSFFGVNRIAQKIETENLSQPLAAVNMLYHGTTLHGQQQIDPATKSPINPRAGLGYYHHDGPIGRFFAAYSEHNFMEIGLIGLGTGGLAAYGEPGQRMTYFEIDAAVQRMAEDTRYFTYISDARTRRVDVKIVLGDARLTLNAYDGPPLDVLILDAFSSDAIPVHLLTREAVAMYVSRLSQRGVIVMHISNRYLNLRPVVANIAADLGLACAINDDVKITNKQMLETGRAASLWTVLARTPEDLAPLAVDRADSPWKSLTPTSRAGSDSHDRTWTDDYVNIIGAMNWR